MLAVGAVYAATSAVIADTTDAGTAVGAPTAAWSAILAAAIVTAAVAFIAVAARRGAMRLPIGPVGGRVASPLLPLALAALMLGMQQVGASLGLALAGGPPEPDASAGAAARAQSFATIGAVLTQLPVIAVALGIRPRSVERRHGALRAVAIGLATTLVIWPIVAAVAAGAAAIQQRVAGTQTEALAHDTLKLIVAPDARPWSAVLAVLAVMAAPVVEETFYRGLLQPAARAMGAGPWTAVIGVAALFAFMHWSVAPPAAVAALFVLGIALGWATERTGGLVAPIVAHAAFNGANLLMTV